MSLSATAGEVRRRERARALTRTARDLAARDGLTGFTVEELCEQVGVSRRTFFNYFASKEDAVLGIASRMEDEEALDRSFLAGPVPSWDGLLDDVANLVRARWGLMDLTPEAHRDLIAALEREPKLLSRLITLAHERERGDAALIRTRMGLPPDDVRAEVLVHVIGAVTRGTTEEFLAAGSGGDDWFSIFRHRLDLTRDVLARPSSSPARPDPFPELTP